MGARQDGGTLRTEHESHERRAQRDMQTGNKNVLYVLLPYAIPVALACGLAGYFYSRSVNKGGELIAQIDLKHRLNMAQVYAFGYQQRHPESVQILRPNASSIDIAHAGRRDMIEEAAPIVPRNEDDGIAPVCRAVQRIAGAPCHALADGIHDTAHP